MKKDKQPELIKMNTLMQQNRQKALVKAKSQGVIKFTE